MSAAYSSFSDDFFVNVDLHTSLPLPQARETVLQFCEALQKRFSDLGDFYQRDESTYLLEGDRSSGAYRWVELLPNQLASGAFNPADMQDAYRQHAWLLDCSRYYLGISHLDVESLDLVYGFNLDYVGNRDAIVCEALLSGSPLAALVDGTDRVALSLEPTLVVALDSDCSQQARIAVETRNSSYQVRTGNYEDQPISVYFTIRAYPRPGQRFDVSKSLGEQSAAGEDLLDRVVIPLVVRPIASAIAAAQ